MVFYNPISTKIYEFPTFIQHKEYTEDQSFVINSKDGSEFHVSPIINYAVQRERVPAIFSKYRRTLESIEEGFLKTTLYDAFRMTANAYTAEELISNRQIFENKVRAKLDEDLLKEGFTISQLTSNLGYPETFKKAIEAKNNAVQTALTAENQVKTAEANAKIQVAKAEGNAQAMLTQAKAEAESYRLKQSSITPMLLQQMWIEKWNGTLPTTQLGAGTNMMYNVK
jgi:regulator of protease activity HflC (stomatin/prohibitin superfamily)